jgi:hypothetical protein
MIINTCLLYLTPFVFGSSELSRTAEIPQFLLFSMLLHLGRVLLCLQDFVSALLGLIVEPAPFLGAYGA